MFELLLPIITKILEYGMLGALTLAAIAAYLNERKRNFEIQEKRIVETRETIKTIENVTNSLEKLTEALRLAFSNKDR